LANAEIHCRYASSEAAPPDEYWPQSRSGMLYATGTGTACSSPAAETSFLTCVLTSAGVPFVNQAASGQLASFAIDSGSASLPLSRSMTAWCAASLSGGSVWSDATVVFANALPAPRVRVSANAPVVQRLLRTL
jgi:hypothetical protein